MTDTQAASAEDEQVAILNAARDFVREHAGVSTMYVGWRPNRWSAVACVLYRELNASEARATATEAQVRELVASNAVMREALENIAKQKQADELDYDDYRSADFQSGHDGCVKAARAVLASIRQCKETNK